MLAKVRDFRGIHEAAIPINGITLIGGDNGAGKTSLAWAIGAALTGENPVRAVKKSQYGSYVRDGAAVASAEIGDDEGRAIIHFPDGKAWTEGTPPWSSAYAAGIASPLNLEPAKAAEAWQAILEAVPTIEQLRAELVELPFMVESVVREVEVRGWDGAHEHFREEGSRLKGRWEQTTGERYGSRRAAHWTPEGFDATLSPDRIAAAVSEAQKAHTEALKRQAVASSDVERLRTTAGLAQAQRAAIRDAGEKMRAAQVDLDDLRLKLHAVEESRRALSCPECGCDVALQNGKLVKVDSVQRASADDEARTRQAITVAAGRIEAAQAEAVAARTRLEAAEQADADLNNHGKSLGDAQSHEDTLANLEAWRKTAKNSQSFIAASALQSGITAHVTVVSLLAPTGLRQNVLDAALSKFSEILDRLSKIAEWGAVVMHPDLTLSYAGRPYSLLSESEQYRARTTVQAAIAEHDGSAVVVFDRFDMLTKNGRNALFRLSKSIAARVVILMSVSSVNEMPCLAEDSESTLFLRDGCSQEVQPC
jgi:hypothetical protein